MDTQCRENQERRIFVSKAPNRHVVISTPKANEDFDFSDKKVIQGEGKTLG